MKDSVHLSVTCRFRFEKRPDSEVVELEAENHSAFVCRQCLEILTVHRRIHSMKIEKVIVQMAEQ